MKAGGRMDARTRHLAAKVGSSDRLTVSHSRLCHVNFLSPLAHHGFNSRLQLPAHSHIRISHISILSPTQHPHFRFNHFRIYFMDNEFKKIN
jgi:hypothetical protein